MSTENKKVSTRSQKGSSGASDIEEIITRALLSSGLKMKAFIDERLNTFVQKFQDIDTRIKDVESSLTFCHDSIKKLKSTYGSLKDQSDPMWSCRSQTMI